jgi:hypothetical protein
MHLRTQPPTRPHLRDTGSLGAEDLESETVRAQIGP